MSVLTSVDRWARPEVDGTRAAGVRVSYQESRQWCGRCRWWRPGLAGPRMVRGGRPSPPARAGRRCLDMATNCGGQVEAAQVPRGRGALHRRGLRLLGVRPSARGCGASGALVGCRVRRVPGTTPPTPLPSRRLGRNPRRWRRAATGHQPAGRAGDRRVRGEGRGATTPRTRRWRRRQAPTLQLAVGLSSAEISRATRL